MALYSFPYILFLSVSAALCRLAGPRLRGAVLLMASWGFYLLCAPRYFPLLLAVTAVSYVFGRLLEGRARGRRAVLCAGLLLLLGTLFVFKYLVFFGSLLSALLERAGLSPLRLPKLLLPAGLSFYIFTVSGYLIDVWRGRSAERGFADYSLFVSFFPAVLSGPIERAGRLLPQIKARRAATGADVKAGVTRFLTGLAKKLLLADQLAVLVNTAYAAPETFTGLQLLSAALAYSLQIYCDFSAYTDLAIGSARLLGIELMENFDAPYLSRSIKEFWRRWHISLSSWFRDYLYFPLGGSRKGRARTYVNCLIVFAVSGLWHGAAAAFVVWGLLNGVYQVLEGLLLPWKRRLREILHIREDAPALRLAQIAVTFLLLTATWVFFRAGSLTQALLILRRIFTMAGDTLPWNLTALGLGRARLLVLALACLGLLLCDTVGRARRWAERLNGSLWPRYAVWSALLLAVLVFGAYGTGYNAQEFVYFQF